MDEDERAIEADCWIKHVQIYRLFVGALTQQTAPQRYSRDLRLELCLARSLKEGLTPTHSCQDCPPVQRHTSRKVYKCLCC